MVAIGAEGGRMALRMHVLWCSVPGNGRLRKMLALMVLWDLRLEAWGGSGGRWYLREA